MLVQNTTQQTLEALQEENRRLNAANELLRQRIAWLTQSMESGRLGAWSLDITTNTVTLSEQTLAMFGLPPGKSLKTFTDVLELIHPDDRDHLTSTIRHTIAEGSEYHVEYRCVLPNGDLRWRESTGRVFRDAEGRPLILQGAVQDITERRQAETALRESEERFAKAFHSSPDAITITVLGEGRFVEMNEGYTKLFGYSREEAIGKTILDLGLWVLPEERSLLKERLNHRETIRDADVHFRHKSGEVRQCRISAEVIEFEGTPCVLSVIHDVTQQKRMEAALREREETALQFQQELKALHEVGIELATVESVDALCRLAVERGRERLGFDRLSIWLVEDDPDVLLGTYGIDEIGNIRPEQDRRSCIPEETRQQFFASNPVGIELDWPLCDHLGEEVGRGWHLTAALRDGERVVGAIYADNFFRRQPLREHQPELLGLYGATIGQLYARARAQAALRANEERFRMVLENSSDIISLIDAEGKLLYLSPAGARVLGYTLEDRPDLCILDIAHPDDLPGMTARFRELLSIPDKRITETFQARHKDGNWLWLETSLTNLLHHDAIQAIVANSRDVTERKQMEAALRVREESALQFQQELKVLHEVGIELATVESVDALCRLAVERGRERLGFDRLSIWLIDVDPDALFGTYGTDENGNTRSERGKRMRSREESRRELFAHDPVAILPDWPLSDERGNKVGQGWHLTAALRDGERVVGVINADNLLCQQPLKEHQPELLGLYGATIGQLYARARAQAALRANEERFRMVLENSSDVIGLIDPAGKLLYRSPGGSRVFGYSLEERINQSVFDVVHPDDLPNAKESFQELLSTPDAQVTLTYRGQRKDGEWGWFETSLTNLLHHDAIQAIVANSRDVTERKQTEQQLEEYLQQLRYLTGHIQSLQEKERAHIAREVHDELGQALTGLKMETTGLKRTLRRTGKMLSPEEMGKKLDSMTELIDTTIQTVRRIATELRPAVLDTLGLVSALEWQAQEFQKRTGIRCDFVAEVEEVPLERAASTAVFRIFQETLTNIARHSEARHVEAHLAEHPAGFLLEVHDDGIGIAARQSSDSASFGLLGMQERALLLGGELTLQGEPGQGTTVTLYVPSHQTES